MITENFNLQPEKLEDDLIQIIPLTENYFDQLFEVAQDPLIWEVHLVKDRYKKEVFKTYFDGAVASKSSFLVFDKATGELIGSTRYYNYQPGLSRIAIVYTFIARKYWGGSYNKSMKTLLLEHVFKYVNSVVFHVGKENIRSQKAVLKIGGKKIGELDFASTGQLTHYEYEIKKGEWEARTNP
ncbi:MAG TPA: GNAT family N-acetyltransferase [Bacteroidia bacterium]|nr:GNAT family N-acetyltransferase [Bacteroidia bacterium]